MSRGPKSSQLSDVTSVDNERTLSGEIKETELLNLA